MHHGQQSDIRLDGTSVVQSGQSQQLEHIEDLDVFPMSPLLSLLVGLALGGVGHRVGLRGRCSLDAG